MPFIYKSALNIPKVETRLSIHRYDEASVGSGYDSGSHLYTELPEEPCSDDLSNETHKIPVDTRSSFSVFGETSCGVPQTAQHLVIDFTHNELDNEVVQKKCCEFWEFIESHPEIHHMMVIPDTQNYPNTPTSSKSSSETPVSSPAKEENVIKEHTAVSMLDFVSREGLIDKSFEAKIPQRFCPLGSREYIENQTTRSLQKKKKRKMPEVCRCGGKCNTCSRIKPAEDVPHSTKEVRKLCENMKKWDLNHPKSMEPPGRVIPLIHCSMQRKVSCSHVDSSV